MTITQGYAVNWRFPSGRSRRELRELVARVFGWWHGTATGGSTTTIIDSRLTRYADDFWRGATAWLEYKVNAPQGYEATVTAFVRSSGTLTVTPAFGQACAAGDAYQLFRYVSKEQIDDALNEVAHGGYGQIALTPNNDLALNYTLSASDLVRKEQVVAVMIAPGNDARLPPRPLANWSILEDHGVLILWLERPVGPDDGLFVLYRLGEGALLYDDVRITIPTDLVQARAVVYLLQNLLTDQDAQGMEKWGQLLRYWNERLLSLERFYQQPTRRVRFQDWRAPSESDSLWTAYGLYERFAS